jgi:leader peptidase (prepilin peptidase)/N-methyltransferase
MMTGGMPAFAAGSLYALILWSISAAAARRRGLRLGPCPWWVIGLSGAATLALHLAFPAGAAPALSAGLVGAIVAGLVDARTGYIFDPLTLAIAASAGAAALCSGRLGDAAVGALVVGTGLALLYLATGRRGIGLGDVKLGSALALGFGPAAGIVALGSAFVLGAVYALVMIGCGRLQRTAALRFGPFIAGGAAAGLSAQALGWHL